MKTHSILTALALGAALTLTPGIAQQPPQGPPPPPTTELKAYLNLTDTQVQQIQDLQKQARDSAETVDQQIETKEEALQKLLDGGTTDAAAVGKAVLEIHALRTQVKKTHDTARTSALNVLTAAQKTKLETLDAAAKLHDEIEQATELGLLTPPDDGEDGPPAR